MGGGMSVQFPRPQELRSTAASYHQGSGDYLSVAVLIPIFM